MSNQIQNPNVKYCATLIIVTLLVLGGSFWVVWAQGDELPSPGITPASRLYFLDEWAEKVVYWLTLGLENKTERLLEFADEKLSEARKLLEENKTSYAEEAKDKYEEYLNKAQGLTQKAKNEGEVGLADKLIDLITQKTLSHQGILTELPKKLPEELPDRVQEIILNIIEISKKGFEEALKAISTQEKRNEIFERFKDLKTEIDKKIEIIRKNLKDLGVPLR